MGLWDFESGMALWVHKPASGSLLFSTPLFSHVSNDDAGPRHPPACSLQG